MQHKRFFFFLILSCNIYAWDFFLYILAQKQKHKVEIELETYWLIKSSVQTNIREWVNVPVSSQSYFGLFHPHQTNTHIKHRHTHPDLEREQDQAGRQADLSNLFAYLVKCRFVPLGHQGELLVSMLMEISCIHSQEEQQLIKIKSDSADEDNWLITWVTGAPGRRSTFMKPGRVTPFFTNLEKRYTKRQHFLFFALKLNNYESSRPQWEFADVTEELSRKQNPSSHLACGAWLQQQRWSCFFWSAIALLLFSKQ